MHHPLGVMPELIRRFGFVRAVGIVIDDDRIDR
jgi:hypothetical protein